jgi:hypothetical protein
MIAYGGSKAFCWFSYWQRSINLGHTGFEINTVHKCIKNQRQTAQNREIPSHCDFRRIKGQCGHLRLGAFVIFLSD